MRLILANPKYYSSTAKMMKHGKDFDCNKECPVCEPYRERDREEWNSMPPEKRRLGVIGLASDSLVKS